MRGIRDQIEREPLDIVEIKCYHVFPAVHAVLPRFIPAITRREQAQIRNVTGLVLEVQADQGVSVETREH